MPPGELPYPTQDQTSQEGAGYSFPNAIEWQIASIKRLNARLQAKLPILPESARQELVARIDNQIGGLLADLLGPIRNREQRKEFMSEIRDAVRQSGNFSGPGYYTAVVTSVREIIVVVRAWSERLGYLTRLTEPLMEEQAETLWKEILEDQLRKMTRWLREKGRLEPGTTVRLILDEIPKLEILEGDADG